MLQVLTARRSKKNTMPTARFTVIQGPATMKVGRSVRSLTCRSGTRGRWIAYSYSAAKTNAKMHIRSSTVRNVVET